MTTEKRVNEHSCASDCSTASWERKWAEMDPKHQRDLWDRVSITPFSVVLRPWWQKLFVAPVVWCQHYRLSRKFMGRFHSARWAFVWTGLLLFPKWFRNSQ